MKVTLSKLEPTDTYRHLSVKSFKNQLSVKSATLFQFFTTNPL